MSIERKYRVKISQEDKLIDLDIEANNSNHAVAQAEDICRALDATSFTLHYGSYKQTLLSTLFKKLALNLFDYKVYTTRGSSCSSELQLQILHKPLSLLLQNRKKLEINWRRYQYATSIHKPRFWRKPSSQGTKGASLNHLSETKA